MTIIETTDSRSIGERSGNALSGAYVGTTKSEGTRSIEQSSRNADDSTVVTTRDQVISKLESSSNGNMILGTSRQETTGTVSQSSSQTGVIAGATIDYAATRTSNVNLVSLGNVVLGSTSIAGSESNSYTFSQTVTSGPESYQLSGSGAASWTRDDHFNSITGSITRSRDGSDQFQLTQIVTDAGGSFQVSLSGNEAVTVSETGSLVSGAYERVTTGLGTGTKVETRSGSSTSSDEAIDYLMRQNGNYWNGRSAQQIEGRHRYHGLPRFVDSGSAGTGTLGVADLSLTENPIALGSGPSMPAPAARGAGAAGVDALFAHAAQTAGSMADDWEQRLSANGLLNLSSGSSVSHAAVTELFTRIGNAALHEYCFAAGTMVVLANGASKPIEQLTADEWLLAVPDGAPLSVPRPHRIARVYHNAPAQLVHLHFGSGILRCTPNHPLYVIERGWTAAADVRVGEHCRSLDGSSIEITDRFDDASGPREPVYNLEVESAGTYFVRTSAGQVVLVHNQSVPSSGPSASESNGAAESNVPEFGWKYNPETRRFETGLQQQQFDAEFHQQQLRQLPRHWQTSAADTAGKAAQFAIGSEIGKVVALKDAAVATANAIVNLPANLGKAIGEGASFGWDLVQAMGWTMVADISGNADARGRAKDFQERTSSVARDMDAGTTRMQEQIRNAPGNYVNNIQSRMDSGDYLGAGYHSSYGPTKVASEIAVTIAVTKGIAAVGSRASAAITRASTAEVTETIANARRISVAGKRYRDIPHDGLYDYNMAQGLPGPLPPQVAAAFAGGKYNAIVLEQDIVLYRGGMSGGGKNALGQWFTVDPPGSIANVRMHSAVKRTWIDYRTGTVTGESPVDAFYAVKIPKGTTVYSGPVSYQGGFYLGGQEMIQIHVPTPWKIPGVQVLGEFPIP